MPQCEYAVFESIPYTPVQSLRLSAPTTASRPEPRPHERRPARGRAGTGTRTRRWAPIRCGGWRALLRIRRLALAVVATRVHERCNDLRLQITELRNVSFRCLLRSRLHRCLPCRCPTATTASAAATSASASLAACASLAASASASLAASASATASASAPISAATWSERLSPSARDGPH